jgi:3',5'-cyclic AMP phosphodiesterase CpdA
LRLYAISDLHVEYAQNRALLEGLSSLPDDWLIVAGDVGETVEQVWWAWRILAARFARVIWTPGNHELWSSPTTTAGQSRYHELVEAGRFYNVLTPEESFERWDGVGGP